MTFTERFGWADVAFAAILTLAMSGAATQCRFLFAQADGTSSSNSTSTDSSTASSNGTSGGSSNGGSSSSGASSGGAIPAGGSSL